METAGFRFADAIVHRKLDMGAAYNAQNALYLRRHAHREFTQIVPQVTL
jgi:hypothetical protein